MNKLIVIILSFLISVLALGQNSDSLHNIYLKNKNQPDLLIELAKSYKMDSIELSIEFAQRAHDLSITLKSNNKIAEAALLLSELYKEHNKFKTARYYAHEAMNILSELSHEDKFYEAMHMLSLVFFDESKFDSSLIYINKVINYANETKNYERRNKLYKTKAKIHYIASDFAKALSALTLQLQILEKINDSLEIALVYNSLSTNSRKLGNYQQAVEYSKKSLSIYETLKDSNGVAECYSSLGSIHYYMDENDIAVKYFIKAFNLFLESGNEFRVAGMSNNIGSVYVEMKEYRKSLIFYTIALEGFANSTNKHAEAIISNNLGLSHQGLGEYNKAEEYFKRSLSVQKEIGNKEGIVHALTNLAGLHLEKGNPRKAHKEYHIALQKAKDDNLINSQLFIYKEMVVVEEKLDMFKDALQSHRNYIAIKDTLFNRESKSQLIEMQTKLELQEQKAKYDLLSADNELTNTKIARQKLFMITIIIVSVLIFLLLLMVLLALWVSRTSKAKLEEKNKQIVYHNNRMTDSIKYARRVQHALIKSSGNLSDYYKNNFIISKAQSIVSGDFFWFKKIDKKIYLVTADCTGHGVPGAFMSVLGLTLINEVLKENIYIPANEVLNELRSKIKEALNQIDLDSNTDGMDVTICIIDSDTNIMEFAGAYNSAYIVRSNKLIELKGDKMSVCIARKEHPFSKQLYNLQKGDKIYLFTDGYIDQLKKKYAEKITSKRLKKFLIDIIDTPIKEQGKDLMNYFEDWKADNEQTDDMLMVGIEI